MEWARHRFRFAFLSSSSSDSISGYKLFNNYNAKRLAILVLFVNVICLPCVVLSAEVRDQKDLISRGTNVNSDIDNTSRNSNIIDSSNSVHLYRQILHREIDKNNSTDRGGNSTQEESLDHQQKQETLESEGESDVQHQNHLKRPSLINRKNGQNDKDCNTTKCNTQQRGQHTGESDDHEEESHSHDSQRIQSILRDIFLDEFGSQDDPEEEAEESDQLILDTLHRSSQDEHREAAVDKSQFPLSRHARSELSEPEPEAPRGTKGGKAKGSKTSPSDNSDNNENSQKGSKRGTKQKKGGKGSGSDLNKYNEYMDSVFRRMNTMIKSKKMDPLRVNLYAGPSKGNQKQKKVGVSTPTKKKTHSARMDLASEETDTGEEDVELDEEDDLENGPARRDIYLNISHHSDEDHESIRKIRALLESVENGTSLNPQTEEDDSPRGDSNSKPKKPKGNRNNENGKPKDKNPSGNSNKKQKAPGQKDKGSKNKKVQNSRPTRGVLHGLSTLKRDGNVAVIKQGDKARIVRANFFLGPVSLEIMPRKSKSGGEGNGKPAAGATATASKLKGVLEVRLKKGSPTRIRRLRVYPPKNVKVDGASGSLSTSANSKGNKKPQQYGKVTPMATARLRQIASTVVRQSDKTLKSSSS